MKHLSPACLVELAEGEAPTRATAEHLDGCAECRSEAESLRQMVQLARDVDAPPVSPLVWEHFPDRVRRAVERDEEAASAPPWWRRWYRRPAVATLAAAMVVLVAVVVGWHLRTPQPDGAAAPGALRTAALSTETADTLLPQDGSWSLVAQAGADLDWEALVEAGVTVQAGSVDRAVSDLSREEQAELARLLRAEMKRGL
jgi:hypothetical protein